MSNTKDEFPEKRYSFQTQDEEENKNINNNSKRRLLAQFIAGTTCGLLMLGHGASFAMPPLIIASLTSGNDTIIATPHQLSWIGSATFITFALTCPFFGMLIGPFGRKKGLMLGANINVISSIVLWVASNVFMIYPALLLFGIETGITAGGSMTYIAEISEPSTRSVMLTLSSLMSDVGASIGFAVGTCLSWRATAAVFMSVPILFTALMLMLPESPVWLLANGRKEEALRSLCWLRGWVKPAAVKEEFAKMAQSVPNNDKGLSEAQSDQKSGLLKTINSQSIHVPESLKTRVRNSLILLKKKETIRPLAMALFLFAFTAMTGTTSIRPSLVNIFRAFNVPVDAHWAQVGFSALALVGRIICVAIVNVAGKRKLLLTGMTFSMLSTACLGVYAYKYVPHHLSSYRTVEATEDGSIIPMVFLAVLWLSNYCSILPLAWTYPSEIFPYRTRSAATGLTFGISGLFLFSCAKLHIHLEDAFGIYGSFFVYSSCTLLGIVSMYLFLVETKNKTIAEIEADFSGDRIKVCADDWFANKVRSIFTST